MNNLLYFVAAYSILWIVLFGYVLNLVKKQNDLKKEIDRLQKELAKDRKDK